MGSCPASSRHVRCVVPWVPRDGSSNSPNQKSPEDPRIDGTETTMSASISLWHGHASIAPFFESAE